MKFGAFLSLLTLSISVQAQDCGTYFNSAELANYVSLLDRVEHASPSWLDFRISDQPIVISNAKRYATCGAVYFAGKIVSRLTLSSTILQPQHVDLQEIIDKLPAGLTPEQKTAIIDKITKDISAPLEWSFIEVNIPNGPPTPVEFKPVLDSLKRFSAIAVNTDENEINLNRVFSTMAHEGFHAFYQGSERPIADRSMYAWPSWSSAIADTGSTVTECYRSTPVVSAFQKSEEANLARAIALLQQGDVSGAKESIAAFFSDRAKREDLVRSGAPMSRDHSSKVSCAFAEAGLELVEGSAQFVGIDSLIKAGLLNERDFVSYLLAESTSDEAWYRTGSLQIYLAKTALEPKLFNEFLVDLSRLDQPDRSLDSLLKAYLKSVGMVI